MVTKQRFSSAWQKQALPVLPSLVRCEWVEEIYRAQTEIPIILLYTKFGLHNRNQIPNDLKELSDKVKKDLKDLFNKVFSRI